MDHNWTSENFPPAFADVVLHNLFGEEREVNREGVNILE